LALQRGRVLFSEGPTLTEVGIVVHDHCWSLLLRRDVEGSGAL
jgi:hypothetical protein